MKADNTNLVGIVDISCQLYVLARKSLCIIIRIFRVDESFKDVVGDERTIATPPDDIIFPWILNGGVHDDGTFT